MTGSVLRIQNMSLEGTEGAVEAEREKAGGKLEKEREKRRGKVNGVKGKEKGDTLIGNP